METISVRFFHVGQVPSRGKVRLLTRPPNAPFSRDELEDLLAGEGVDLVRFGAWIQRDEVGGYVALEDLTDIPALKYDGSGWMLLVRLEERPAFSRNTVAHHEKGYFGIGIVRGKTAGNHGTLWRSAFQLGAAFIFTVGKRYGGWEKSSDTYDTARRVPCFDCADWASFAEVRPFGAPLVGVEMGGVPLSEFSHPDCCIYVLGAEDGGLPRHVQEACTHLVSIPALRDESYNVAVAGSLVMYDRMSKATVRPTLRDAPRVGSEVQTSLVCTTSVVTMILGVGALLLLRQKLACSGGLLPELLAR